MESNDIYEFFPELNKEEDIGEQLNQLYYSKILDGRPVYLWGTGNTAKILLQEISNLNIKAFIDNNSTKSYVHYNGKDIEVINPAYLEDDVYIIIASIYYKEICSQMEGLGKTEYLDFISWNYLLPTPKSMLKAIMDTPRVTNWKCAEAMRIKRLQSDGECYFCSCPVTGLNEPIVNIFLDRAPIEKSIKARLFFYSIFTGKYTYCKKRMCHGLRHNWNNFQSENLQWKRLEESNSPIAKVIVPDFDRTCNLQCKKCRTQIIYEESSVLEYLTDYFITQWMPYSKVTKLAGNGEVMASKYYRRILEHVESQEGIVLYSNGTLLKRSVISKLSEKTNGNCFFIISLDAVKEDTYCKLQGGNFDILTENLKAISEMAKSGKIKGFISAFVVSKQNEAEMEAFVDWMRRLGAEAVIFLTLQNFGTYPSEEFEEVSLFTEDNRPKTKILENKILRLQQLEDIKVFFCDPEANTLAYKRLGFE